ncbi:O-antigen ligase family protein [Marinobacter caseinilyticus]|uniref:O-antigen ligase family protein n=1 Tax=Marinobacter caseinilyticus TaxID=2692195 RepID=UPI0014080E08|nr:O-antigen ligase family protein [Marinobacter caseinilyticus]
MFTVKDGHSLMRSPIVLISTSLLLFLLLAILVPWKDVYRFFFFAGVMPGVIWALYQGEKPLCMGARSIKALILLVLYLSLNSFLVSSAPLKDSVDSFRWGGEILFLIMGILYASEHWMRRPIIFGRLILSGVFLASVLVLMPYVTNGFFDLRLVGVGFLEHPIQGASSLLVLWAIGFALMGFATSVQAADWLLIALSGLAMLTVAVFSQSRGPVIASVITVLLMTGPWLIAHPRSKLWLYIIFGVSLGGFWVLLPQDYADWFFEMMMSRGLSYRPEIWSSVLEYAANHWIFGSGAATEFVDTSAGAALKSELGFEFAHSHNIFLEIFLIGGVFALFILLSTICVALKRLWEAPVSGRSKLLAVSVLLVVIMVNFTDTAHPISSPSANWMLLWLPLVFWFSTVYSLRSDHSHDVENQ